MSPQRDFFNFFISPASIAGEVFHLAHQSKDAWSFRRGAPHPRTLVNVMNHEQPNPDGLQQLQALLDGGLKAPMGRTLGFELVEVERGRVVFEGKPDRSVYNPLGAVHGGYAATLLDSACGCAVHSSLPAGHGYTTLELKVAYHRALSDTSGPVRAEGKLVSLGRRVAFSEARLVDSESRLCASATSTLLVFPLNPDAA